MPTSLIINNKRKFVLSNLLLGNLCLWLFGSIPQANYSIGKGTFITTLSFSIASLIGLFIIFKKYKYPKTKITKFLKPFIVSLLLSLWTIYIGIILPLLLTTLVHEKYIPWEEFKTIEQVARYSTFFGFIFSMPITIFNTFLLSRKKYYI